MPTKIVKWSAIAILIGGVFLRPVAIYGLLSQVVVAGAAGVVLTQAAFMRRYVWMSLFLLVACLFNPIFPVPSSNYIFGIMSAFSVLLFFFSLELLHPRPSLSVAVRADRTPARKSL
jgi:hypothetical protein